MAHGRGLHRLGGHTAMALVLALGLGLSGCKSSDITGSIGTTSTSVQRNLDALERRVERNPDDNQAVIAYSKALFDARRPDEAGVILARAIARKPGQGDLMREYGKLLHRTGRMEQAAQVLEQARAHGADTWDTFSALGASYDSLGQHQKAKAAYDAAMALNPSSTSLLTNYGLHHAYQKDLKSAEGYLRRAVAQPDAGPAQRQNLALILGLQGKFDEAQPLMARDLPPDQVEKNMEYMRQMLRSNNTWDAIRNSKT